VQYTINYIAVVHSTWLSHFTTFKTFSIDIPLVSNSVF